MGLDEGGGAVVVEHCDPGQLPRDLLLLADPSPDMVETYIQSGWGFLARCRGEAIGEALVCPLSPRVVELVNLAVAPHWQGRGIGKLLILAVAEDARKKDMRSISLGTGNSSLDQLAFYQKCGFRLVGVERDFFLRNYSAPIYENGIQCWDMIRLSLALSSCET